MVAAYDDRAHTNRGVRLAGPDESTRARLTDAWHVFRDQDGDFGVPAEAFVDRVQASVRERLDEAPGATVHEVLDRLVLRDVYLVMGCLNRSDRAFRLFMERFGALIDRIVRTYVPVAALADDVRAELLATLFLPRGDGDITTARLYGYRGMGGLQGFLRVAGRRLATDALRRLRYTEGDERLAHVADPREAADHRLATRDGARRLLPLLRECIDGLSDEDRRLMNRSHRDGLLLREIADADGVNISTVHRRLEKVQKTLWKQLHQRALAQLGFSGDELRTLLGTLAEDIDLSALFSVALLLLVEMARISGGIA